MMELEQVCLGIEGRKLGIAGIRQLSPWRAAAGYRVTWMLQRVAGEHHVTLAWCSNAPLRFVQLIKFYLQEHFFSSLNSTSYFFWKCLARASAQDHEHGAKLSSSFTLANLLLAPKGLTQAFDGGDP
jgi:hypothetical protein